MRVFCTDKKRFIVGGVQIVASSNPPVFKGTIKTAIIKKTSGITIWDINIIEVFRWITHCLIFTYPRNSGYRTVKNIVFYIQVNTIIFKYDNIISNDEIL